MVFAAPIQGKVLKLLSHHRVHGEIVVAGLLALQLPQQSSSTCSLMAIAQQEQRTVDHACATLTVGATYVEMVIAACASGQPGRDKKGFVLEDFLFLKPMILRLGDDDKARKIYQ